MAIRVLWRFGGALLRRLVHFCREQQLVVPAMVTACLYIWEFALHRLTLADLMLHPLTGTFPVISAVAIVVLFEIGLAARDLIREMTTESEQEQRKILHPDNVPPGPPKALIIAIASTVGVFIFGGELFILERAFPNETMKVPIPAPPPSPSVTPPQTTTAEEVPCYLDLVGQSINGMAPVMVVDQTPYPVDDVSMQVNQLLYDDASASEPHRVGWTKQLDIGTCRARLSYGDREEVPIPVDQDRFQYWIFILTRFNQFGEKISFTRKSSSAYSVALLVYKASDPTHPIVQHDSVLNVVENVRVPQR